MSRNRTILISVVAVMLVMAVIHFTINGLPDLGSWNPHNR